jgi:hypothetical protein
VNEREADKRELEEAEALRRALDGETPSGPIPQDALAAAQLLSASRPEASLDPDRAEEILDRILSEERAPRPLFSWLRWLVPASAAASLLAVFLLWPAVRRAPTSPVVMPAPPRELLLAQARAARGGSLGDLDGAMSGYRGELLASLSRKYAEEP